MKFKILQHFKYDITYNNLKHTHTHTQTSKISYSSVVTFFFYSTNGAAAMISDFREKSE
jgi:hypothetical protein